MIAFALAAMLAPVFALFAPSGATAAQAPRASVGSAPPHLISYQTGEHPRFDRVVWIMSGGIPAHTARYLRRVTEDGSGGPVRLEGRAFLQITLKGLDWTTHVPAEPILTPRLAVIRQMKPAGVFEGYFTFGLGLAYRTTYRFSTARHPDRLILDLDRR